MDWTEKRLENDTLRGLDYIEGGEHVIRPPLIILHKRSLVFGLLLSLRRNSTGIANMIRETLQALGGANTLAAAGYLDLLNKILALHFQDLKLCKKTIVFMFSFYSLDKFKFDICHRLK